MDDKGIGILLVVAVVFTAPYLFTRFSARRAIGKTTPDFSALLPDGADVEKTLYFYFMSENCPMCSAMSPMIKKLQLTNPNIIYININDSAEFVRSFYVRGTPSLYAVKNNVIIKAKLGGLSESKLLQFISSE